MSFLPNIKIPIRSPGNGRTNGVEISKKLVESARTDIKTVLQQLDTTPSGLNQTEVESRLEQYGANEVAREKRQTWLLRLWENVKIPWSSCWSSWESYPMSPAIRPVPSLFWRW